MNQVQFLSMERKTFIKVRIQNADKLFGKFMKYSLAELFELRTNYKQNVSIKDNLFLGVSPETKLCIDQLYEYILSLNLLSADAMYAWSQVSLHSIIKKQFESRITLCAISLERSVMNGFMIISIRDSLTQHNFIKCFLHHSYILGRVKVTWVKLPSQIL